MQARKPERELKYTNEGANQLNPFMITNAKSDGRNGKIQSFLHLHSLLLPTTINTHDPEEEMSAKYPQLWWAPKQGGVHYPIMR